MSALKLELVMSGSNSKQFCLLCLSKDKVFVRKRKPREKTRNSQEQCNEDEPMDVDICRLNSIK